MKHRTVTTYGELKIADRFYFLNDKVQITYQITRCIGGVINYYNQVVEGRSTMIYDKPAKGDKQVVFLRNANQPEEAK